MEHLLRLTGTHKRFIRGSKTVQPNNKSAADKELEDDLWDNDRWDNDRWDNESDDLFGLSEKLSKSPWILERGRLCLLSLGRFYFWILIKYREVKYQLWGGERYDTLKNLQGALKFHLVRYIITTQRIF